jgi:hypothetical protein
MKITVYLLVILSALLIKCTSPEVSAVKDSSIYSIDDGAFYLRKITISGDRIYFVVDEKGQVISGTSSAQKQGKTVSYVSSVVP